MANVDISQIKVALTDTFRTLKSSKGYLTNLEDNLIFSEWSPTDVNNSEDSTYPRIFVIFSVGQDKQLPSEGIEAEYEFLVLFQAKEIVPENPVGRQIEIFIKEARKLLYHINPSLNQLVHTVRIDRYVTDSGSLHPEGVVLLQVVVETAQIGWG